MKWEEVCKNKQLQDLPFKIELIEVKSTGNSISNNGKSFSLPELPIEDYRTLLTTHAHWKSPRLGTKSLILETQAGNPPF